MGQTRRFIPEGEPTVVATTNRTVQSRFLLRPGPELNEIIDGAIARAQRKYGVKVHGYVFLSNHYHLVSTVTSAKQLSDFTGYFQSKIAKEVCRLHDWSDKVWARRYHHSVLLDEEAQAKALEYILKNGCKEGLVGSPLEWPGVHCAKALAKGRMRVHGTWFNRTRLWAAKQRKDDLSMREFMEPEPLELTPLPAWSDKSHEIYAAWVAGLVESIEQETAEFHRVGNTAPLGPTEVLRQDPHAQPIRTKRSPAPLVHASTKAARLAFRAAYNAFVAACVAATERLRATGDSSGFPVGAFLPPLAVATFDSS